MNLHRRLELADQSMQRMAQAMKPATDKGRDAFRKEAALFANHLDTDQEAREEYECWSDLFSFHLSRS